MSAGKGQTNEAAGHLTGVLKAEPKNIIALYQMAKLRSGAKDAPERRQLLRRVLDVAPANAAARMWLAESLAESGQRDSCLASLIDIRKQMPELTPGTTAVYDKASSLIKSGNTTAALPYIAEFRRLLEMTPQYASTLAG